MKASNKWFNNTLTDPSCVGGDCRPWRYYDILCAGQGAFIQRQENSSCTTKSARHGVEHYNDTGGECMNNTHLKIYSTCIGGEVKAYRPGAGPDEQVTATGTGESFPMWGIGLLLLVPGLAFIILYM